jgi:hypothetical protein
MVLERSFVGRRRACDLAVEIGRIEIILAGDPHQGE